MQQSRKRHSTPYISPPTGPHTCAPGDESEFPSQEDGRVRCNARLRNEGSIRCRSWALLGSDKCKKHGGQRRTMIIPYAGRYGEVLGKGTLAAAYQKHRQSEDYKSLRDELAMMRAFTEAFMMQLDGLDITQLTPIMCSAVMLMVQEVRALVETMARVDQKISVTLSITDVYGLVQQIFEIVRQYVHEPTVLRKIGEGLQMMELSASELPNARRPVLIHGESESETIADSPISDALSGDRREATAGV